MKLGPINETKKKINSKLLLIAIIALAIIASGCTGGQDVTSAFKALPEVQQFMKEHPNAKITVTYWSKEEVAQSLKEINRQCEKSITPVPMYKAIISEGDLKIISWVDAESKIVICSTTEGVTPTLDITQSPSPVATQVEESSKVTLYFFWGNGCSHCAAEKPFLEKLKHEYPGLKVMEFEVWYSEENQTLFKKFLEAYNVSKPYGVPTIFIGKEYIVGYDTEAITGLQIENLVKDCIRPGCPNAGKEIIASEKAGKLSLNYVKNDATYMFDGIPESLNIKEILPCSDCWKVTVYFESKQAGYGDRTGQVLAQVITPHEARIVVEKGEIISAIMDNRWDMKSQSTIPKVTPIPMIPVTPPMIPNVKNIKNKNEKLR